MFKVGRWYKYTSSGSDNLSDFLCGRAFQVVKVDLYNNNVIAIKNCKNEILHNDNPCLISNYFYSSHFTEVPESFNESNKSTEYLAVNDNFKLQFSTESLEEAKKLFLPGTKFYKLV